MFFRLILNGYETVFTTKLKSLSKYQLNHFIRAKYNLMFNFFQQELI